MENQRILVTVGAGFIATNLVNELNQRGHEVISTDLHNTDLDKYQRADVKNYRQLEKVFDNYNFDFVYHLAAEYGRWNGEAHYENLWQTNVAGTKYMIHLQEKLGFSRMDFEDGLKRTSQWFVNNWENINASVEFYMYDDPGVFFDENSYVYNQKVLPFDYYFMKFIQNHESNNDNLLDIGGGNGNFSNLIIENCPDINVTILDSFKKTFE